MDSRQTEEPMLFRLSQFTTGDLTFEEYLRLLQACEVKSVEIAASKLSPIEERARDQILELTESGITVSGVVPRVHALFPDTLNPMITDLEERLDSFHASIDFFARALPGVGLPILTITGAAPGVHLRDSYAYALRAYRELVHHAASVGVRLMFEPLGPVLMNTDTFICTLYRAMELIERVDHPDFGLALDSWHVWDEPLLPERIVSAGDRIFGVQVSDYPRNEPRGFADRIIPGEGCIDFRSFFGAVEAAEFGGPIVLEIFSAKEYPDSLWRADPYEVVAQGRRAIERLWLERHRPNIGSSSVG
ncbi:MAG TPA: sugar phosphate isomerase/epimerase family protein [Bauldia sp.]